jgi:uncharacterized protein with FMN-binding domain
MYAMVRRYQIGAGSMDDLMHRVDTQFADRLQEQLGILHYQAIGISDGTIMTVTVFEDEERCRRSETAAAGVRESLVEFQVEEMDALTGEVMVSRASEKMLEPIHHRASIE